MADSDNKTGNKLPNETVESQKSNDPTLPKPDERVKEVLKNLLENKPLLPNFKEHLSLKNKDVAQDIELKKQIVKWVKRVVSIYLVVVGVFIAYTGWQEQLDTIVLVTLLTTTTINILGLPLMIILSLFPKRNKSDKSFNS